MARCRAMVCDDENDQGATQDAFELLDAIVTLRLRAQKFTVVDALNLRAEERKRLKGLAKAQDCLTSVLLFDTPQELCLERTRNRTDHTDPQTVLRQLWLFQRAGREVKCERYHRLYRLTPERQKAARVERLRLECDRNELGGPFDIIGDLHGCAEELKVLLSQLGYGPNGHPAGRTAVFLGDLTDRGPRSLECYEIVSSMVERGQALCVAGNHDAKLVRYLQGKNVAVNHGLETTRAELDHTDKGYRRRMLAFFDSLPSHYVLDGGRLVVAHAGIKKEYQGRASGRVRRFCLYGETTGESDEYGLPVRSDWAADYRGEAMVVYGHTPVVEPEWVNRTLNIDTGCVFGGRLTALRYPELQTVSVVAQATYCVPKRPLKPPTAKRASDVLTIED